MGCPDATTYELTQKQPGEGGGPGTLTTIYLSEEQARSLEVLPADLLARTRSAFPPYGVELFEGPLTGRLLVQAEAATAGELAQVPAPPGSVSEVTALPQFTGGRLARTSEEELGRLLRAFGIGGPATGRVPAG
ncbi:MAG TPA: hypothetical protein VMI11_11145 [Actinomycetes bacterium]|nr:hypothetical protein [Actinomycetes bacterium]